MILILPLAYLGLLGAMVLRWPAWGFRRSVIRAALIWGAYAVLTIEVLSLLSAVTPLAVLVAWLLLDAACLLVVGFNLVRGHKFKIGNAEPKTDAVNGVLMVEVLIPVVVTAIVAWYSPPQTWDSLNYHMARVAHWAQQASVEHFATGIEVQNSRPPGAEFMVLHTYLLAGGDRYANFVQWSAMLLSLAGVSLIAGQLGAGRRGQLAAAVFVATLPMGIIQASSTTNDYLVALWVLGAASEALTLREQGPRPEIMLFLGLSAGLGLATKPTAVAYLAPIGAFVLYQLFARHRIASALRWSVAAVALVTLPNIGHLVRNLSTFGSFLDPAQVAIHSNQLGGPRGVISNLLRNAALHAGTPSPHVNKGLALAVEWIHELMDLDVNDPRTTAHGVFKISTPTTNEDRAGNHVQAYLIVGLVGYLLVRRGRATRLDWLYLSLLGTSMLVLSYLFKWQIFASRYHLAFFVLAGALAGRLLERADRGRWLPAITAAMFVASWPWLLQIKSRPLIPKEGVTYVGSVLRAPRFELYLANGRHLLDPYLTFAALLREAGCQEIGIALSGNGAEYPIWVYLGAPGSGAEIEWIVSGTPSAKYRAQEFEPCGVICEGCPEDWEEIRGLPLAEARNDLRLFLTGAGNSE